MKLQLCIAALLLLCMQGRPQAQTASIQPLKPGDTVPDVALQLVNYTRQQARLYDFTGKLLILEFWSPRCSGCARKVAWLDSLQNQSGSSVCIMPVSSIQTTDKPAAIQRFIKGYQQRIKNSFIMPVAVNDSILAKLFPFITVPDFIWIRNKVYLARTGIDELTPANITAAVNGAALNMVQKRDREYYDRDSMLQNYIIAGDKVQLVYSHLYEGTINRLEPVAGYVRDTLRGNRIVAVNSGTGSLYALAYNAPAPLYNNLIINETKEKHLLDDIVNPATASHTIYNYEYIKHAGRDELRKQMQADLCNYFHVQAAVEKRRMDCLVLEGIDTVAAISKGAIPGNSLYEDIQGGRLIRNQPIDVLTERLNELYNIPVVNETHICQNIDLTLPNDLTDVAALKNILGTQGIRLTSTVRPVEVFVLSPAANCPH